MNLHSPEIPITGAIKHFSDDKLHQGLGFEYQHRGGSVRRLCMFYTFLSTEPPSHIQSLLIQIGNSNWHQNIFNVFFLSILILQSPFFPYVNNEWINVIQTLVSLVFIIYIEMHCKIHITCCKENIKY